MPTNHRGIFPDAFILSTTYVLLAHWCTWPHIPGQTLPMLWVFWHTSMPILVWPIGMQSSIYFIISGALPTLHWPMPLTSLSLPQRLFTTFSDADHGGCKDSGHSTSAYVVKMGTGVISWSSKLQGLVAQATTEAEHIAAVEAGKEIVWLCNLLEKMGFFVSSPSILHTDNQSAIQVAKNPEHHGCMKHLDLCWFWLRDVVDQGVISPVCPHNWDACWLVDQAIGSSQGATVLQDVWTSPIRGKLGYQRCAIMGESSCCTWATSNGCPPQAPASPLCPFHIAHNCH